MAVKGIVFSTKFQNLFLAKYEVKKGLKRPRPFKHVHVSESCIYGTFE